MPKWITRTLEISPTFRDFDMMGVIHNSVYFEWFERGRLQVMNEVMTFGESKELAISVAVRENRCVYERAIRQDDVLTLITKHKICESYTGKLEFTHELINKKTKVSHAYGDCICTIINPLTGELLRDWNNYIWQRYLLLK